MELRLILGDQLNAGHSWFRTQDAAVCYLMVELRRRRTTAATIARRC